MVSEEESLLKMQSSEHVVEEERATQEISGQSVETQAIKSLIIRLGGLEKQIAQQNRVLSEREQILLALNSSILEIKTSTAWRIIQGMWRVRLFLAPPGSARERIGRSMIGLLIRKPQLPAQASINTGNASHNAEIAASSQSSSTIIFPTNLASSPDTDLGGYWCRWDWERFNRVDPLPTSAVTDIVICVGPDPTNLIECFEAIQLNTESGSYSLKLVVHQDDVQNIPSHIRENAQVIEHSMEVFSFARANNLALSHCDGDVVLLNDDTEVSPGWLEKLRQDSHGIALTGARTGRKCSGNPDLWEEGPSQLTWYSINMFCAFIPRRLREVVGGLDEEFTYYGGEDVDYSCRALQNGFPLVVSSAFVHHRPNSSYGELTTPLMWISDKLLVERYALTCPYSLESIQPVVSVVMATHNRAQLLPLAVQAILDGDYPNIELIIVDDASQDDTWEVIGALQQMDNRVLGVRLPENHGMVKAREKGVAISRGQFIAFSDDDDHVRPNRISAPLNYLMLYPELDVTYCNFEVVFDSGRQPGITEPFDVDKYLDMKFAIGNGILLIRKKICLDVPFMSTYERATVFDWVFRILRNGYRIDYCPAVVLDYNRTGPPTNHLADNIDAFQIHRAIQEREEILKQFKRSKTTKK
jgi:GT2 family glycosyltransferase